MAVSAASDGESGTERSHASSGTSGTFTSSGGGATLTGNPQAEQESDSEGDDDEADVRRRHILDAAMKHVVRLVEIMC